MGAPVTDYVARSFDAFMADEWPGVLAFARATTGSWGEAEDLAQDAFIAAYRDWAKVSKYERPDAFVRRVVANRSVSGVRRRVREAAALRRLGHGEVIDTEGTDPAFWAAVRRLPVRQRHVVALHYLEDRSIRDIAEVLEIAEGTVKAHLHAGRKALASMLAMEEES